MMFNKFLLLLMTMLLSTPMVWGQLRHAQATSTQFQNQTDQGNYYDDEAPFLVERDPTYNGNGCPGGTVSITTTGSTVSVIFSAYQAMTSSSKTFDRKSCNMAVPVYAKPGFSIGIFKVDYRGYANAPRGGYGYNKPKATFNAEYFFAGSRGPRKSRTYTNGYDDNFFESDSVGAWAWSPCGGSTNFRINTSISASKSSRTDPDVLIMMDSEDITQEGFHYYFTSKHC